MAKGRMTKVMGKGNAFGKFRVEAESAGDGSCSARDLDCMGEASPDMITVRQEKHLRLVHQSPECCRVHNTIAILLEGCPIPGWVFRVQPIGRVPVTCCVWPTHHPACISPLVNPCLAAEHRLQYTPCRTHIEVRQW